MRDVEELIRQAMHEQTPHLTSPGGAAARALRAGRRRRRLERAGTGLVVAVVVAGLVGLAGLGHRARGVAGGTTSVTLTAAGPATSRQLRSAADIVRARLAAAGVSARTSVSGSAIRVTVRSAARAAVGGAVLPGVLTFREIYTGPTGNPYDAGNPGPSADHTTAVMTVVGLDAPAAERN